MSDRDWREAERAWQAEPQDRTRYEAAIAARRRADVPISGPLLEDLIHPPRTFESTRTLHVRAMTPDRQIHQLGSTPGVVELDAHRDWWVGGFPPSELLTEIEERALPGLEVLGSFAELWERIRHLNHLRTLWCSYLQDPAILARLPRDLVRLTLLIDFGNRPDWSHSLPPLPHLTELWLIKTPLEPITLTALARLPNLRRLHVENPTRHLRGAVHEALPHCRLGSVALT